MVDKLVSAIQMVERACAEKRRRLPNSVFFLIGRLTPFVNVDLLVLTDDKRCVLTWRDDVHSGMGWHLPGGIIRFQEMAISRVRRVAHLELSVRLRTVIGPTKISQIIDRKKKDRSHFISLLYVCQLSKTESKKLRRRVNAGGENQILLCSKPPRDLLKWHRIYNAEIATWCRTESL